jgi:hypothetical protein
MPYQNSCSSATGCNAASQLSGCRCNSLLRPCSADSFEAGEKARPGLNGAGYVTRSTFGPILHDTIPLEQKQSFGGQGTNPRITSQQSTRVHSSSTVKTDLKTLASLHSYTGTSQKRIHDRNLYLKEYMLTIIQPSLLAMACLYLK